MPSILDYQEFENNICSKIADFQYMLSKECENENDDCAYMWVIEKIFHADIDREFENYMCNYKDVFLDTK